MPSRHFGVTLEWDDWVATKDRLVADSTNFIIALTTQFAGEIGEQATMFLHAPSGNALEFNTLPNKPMIFAH